MNLKPLWFFVLVLACPLTQALAQDLDTPWRVIPDPNNSFSFKILSGTQTFINIGLAGWGPDWSWADILKTGKVADGILAIQDSIKLGGKKVDLGLSARMRDPRTFEVTYTVTTAEAVPLTLLCVVLTAPDGKKNFLQLAGDQPSKTELPAPRGIYGKVTSVAITDGRAPQPVVLAVSPPVPTFSDGNLRMGLGEGKLSAGVKTLVFTYSFPQDATFFGGAEALNSAAPLVPGADWFPYDPSWTVKGEWNSKPGVIGLEDWLDKPAGKHGGVRMVGDQFRFEDGTPVKFWGMNLAFAASAPSKEDADFTAARFAKFGVNAVRMHKFTGSGWEGIGDPEYAEKMTPEGLDRLDYFASQLTKRGVYYGWSHTFGFKVKPGDKSRISGYDELMAQGGNTYSVINWAEDVQDLLIETVVNLLNHKNKYTGKFYYEDPALNYIELQNEDDIFFFTSGPAYKNFPTYAKQLRIRFSQWLKAKYGTREKLADAWGGSLKGEENLDSAAVEPQLNPWFMGSANLPNLSGGPRQRMLDNADFLHETQDRFYHRFIKAIRDTGYKGPICGSPWQAPSQVPYLYNLKTDHDAGFIDRHNYFEGSIGSTMLKTPGGGYLSTGLQQVIDRPFSLSEWITAYPDLYSAEGPFLVAAYGLGLQGWDSSYEFQSVSGKPGPLLGNLPWGIWNGDAPTQIGQYPVLSRMVLRGDVKEAPVLSVRRVSPENLAAGKLDFSDETTQNGDVKTFTGTVPAETLAVGRAVVEFTETTKSSTFPDLGKYRDGDDLVSSTGQLRWNGKEGNVRVNTPGTQGFVGFAPGRKLVFDDLSLQTDTPYAMVLATAVSRDKSLATDDSVLISAVGRAANKGMRVMADDGKTIVDNGKEPILLEPVRFKVIFRSRKVGEVKVLDFDGRVTRRTVVPGDDGTLDLDTGRDKTMDYLVTFAP